MSTQHLQLTGDEPCLNEVPLVDMPAAGDEAALVGVLARILVDLCAVPVPDTLLLPVALAEAA